MAHARALSAWLLIAALVLPAGADAARVDVQIEGLDEEMRDAVRATLQLNQYEKRDISPAELRAAWRDADAWPAWDLVLMQAIAARIWEKIAGADAVGRAPPRIVIE